MNILINKEIVSHSPKSHGGLYSIKNPKPDLLDFSSNINPLGPSFVVQRILKQNLGIISQYPDSYATNLRKAISSYTKTPFSQIIVGNGATEIIYYFCRAFLEKNSKVLITAPTFAEYESASNLSGCNISFFRTMQLGKTLDKFLLRIPENGIIFICNPNNPTGELLSKYQLGKIIRTAKKKKSFVFVDESFIELVPDYNQSIIKFVKKFNNLFILRSMTKSFGLAGIRIGYGISNSKIISILNNIKIPWNVNGLALKTAEAALSDIKHLDNAKKIIKKESVFLCNSISKISGFECHDTTTNFILIKTKTKSKILQNKLLKKKILIRDCSSFHGLNQNYIRIAVKTRKENLRLIKALENLK